MNILQRAHLIINASKSLK